MAAIDPSALEALLHMSEGDMLDFKEQQYAFAGASDETKSELVKDIMAFANAWKTGDAYIVVGVRENPGARATVVGGIAHIDDADLQQLVNGKTSTPVSFEYVPASIDGEAVGVILIRKDQQRPIFLRKAFGKLKPNVVYVRRGSSTAEASPDEIARMGTAAANEVAQPQLAIELGDPKNRSTVGTTARITSKVLKERSQSEGLAFDDSDSDSRLGRFVPASMRAMRAVERYALPRAVPMDPLHHVDPKKLAAYRKEIGLLARLGFQVTNIGRVLVEDVRIVVEIPNVDGLRVLDELPERPMGLIYSAVPRGAPLPRAERRTDVEDLGDRWELVTRLGKIQPNSTVWSRPFWIGGPTEHHLRLVGRAFGDNIVDRLEVPFEVIISVEHDWIREGGEDEDDE